MHSMTAAATEAIPYGTESVRTEPPGIIAAIGFASAVVAVLTIAMCAWSATRAYYTAPPAAKRAATVAQAQARASTGPPARVTVEQGDAIVDGIGLLIPLTSKHREVIKKMLVSAEGRIEVRTPPEPTAAKIAAAASDSGRLFGEEGHYAQVGQVRVEVAGERVSLSGVPASGAKVTSYGAGSSMSVEQPSGGFWSFEPAPPPPVTQPTLPLAAAPPPPPTLREQLNDLAPRLPYYGDAIVSSLLAALLLAGAVGLLHYSRRGRLLHLVWAWVKLPLALGAAAAYFWLTMGGKFQLPTGVTPWTQFILAHPEFCASLLIALYAVLVLILLNVPPVRRYFHQIPSRSL